MSDQIANLVQELRGAIELAKQSSVDNKAQIDLLKGQLADLVVAGQRPRVEAVTEQTLATRAALKIIRQNSEKNLTPEERDAYYASINTFKGYAEVRGLSEAVDPTAGYLLDVTFADGVVKAITDMNPIRQYARVIPTSNASVKVRKRTGLASATWVGETTTRGASTNPTYGLVDVPIHELWASVPVTRWLLEDSAVNLQTELTTDISEQFAITEGQAFITGSGVHQPEGILTNSAVLANYRANVSTSAIDGAKVRGLYAEIPAFYAQRAVYVMNRSTFQVLLEAEDGAGNWLLGTTVGPVPLTIMGRPVVIADAMPSVASDAYPILFADLQSAYWIFSRNDIRMQRDEITRKSTAEIDMDAYMRVGGAVVNPSAAAVLKMSAS